MSVQKPETASPPGGTHGPGRGWRALAGLLAGALGIALSVGLAIGLRAATNPVLAVASWVRDHTPGPLVHPLIESVGHADKPLLIAGTVVILLALCAWAGVLTLRRPLYGELVFVVLAVVGLLAILTQPHHGTASILSLVVGLVGWIVALRLLTGQLDRPTYDIAATDAVLEVPSRRGFLLASGGVVVVGALAVAGGRLASRGRDAVEQARRLLRLPIRPGVVPVQADLHVPGAVPWVTKNQDFYLVSTALMPPAISPSTWSLRIHGMVDREVHINYNDLVARPMTETWCTLTCVSNTVGGPLVSNAHWSGVPIREILAEAGVQPRANAVKQTSYDGWTCGTPVSALTDPHREALLAVGMNGQPLPVEHGFPVRMIVPGLYGYVSATKWLVDLEVTTFDKFTAYWTREGWSPQGPIKTESRIDYPGPGWAVNKGPKVIGGKAWAQHTGIANVEFQVDDGPWTPADLGSVPNDDTWVYWAGNVDLSTGDHRLRVRATDKSGYTQTSVDRGSLPNGATGWHTITVHAS